MIKAIHVSYRQQGQDESCEIRVSYRLESVGATKQLSCMVTPLSGDEPAQWLQLRNFEIRATRQGRGYTLLYNDRNHQSNLDTSLFIDKACKEILEQEKIQLC